MLKLNTPVLKSALSFFVVSSVLGILNALIGLKFGLVGLAACYLVVGLAVVAWLEVTKRDETYLQKMKRLHAEDAKRFNRK